MKEFTVQKIGETIAFTDITLDLLNKAKESFAKIFSEDDIKSFVERCEKHTTKLLEFSEQKNIVAAVKSARDAMRGNLNQIVTLFPSGDDARVYTCWSFVGGGSVASWNILKGIIESVEDDALIDIAYDGIALHESLYDDVLGELTNMGRTEVK